MRINKLKSSDFLRAEGIFFEEITRLKQVVALFGKNGSGKTRLLNNLQREVEPMVSRLINAKGNIDKIQDLIKEGNLPRENSSALEFHQKEYDELSQYLGFVHKDQGNLIINLSNRKRHIDSHENMMDQEYREGALQLITNPNYNEVRKNCMKFIKSLCRSEISKEYHKANKGKEHYKLHHEIESRNIKILKLLKDTLYRVMGKELSYNVDEHLTPIVTLNDWVVDVEKLSEGERELLIFCTYLVLQSHEEIENDSLSIAGKIIIVDEIELYLHPKAQIDVLEGLRKLVGEEGQIWLATHSLPILSVLDRDEIWLMENGNITSPSIETPNKVLNSLVGEENIDGLENFLSSQYEWASIQFALECLFPPSVVGDREGDPQQNQVESWLGEPEQPVKVLDFGAGEGRIASELLRNHDVAKKIYYQALEIETEFHPNLKQLTQELNSISEVENKSEREVLDTYEKLNETKYQNFFDVILLVNVLHEIPINKWNVILNSLLSALNRNGRLLVLEDQAIPRGENAHEYGFLILDKQEFQLLFKMDALPQAHEHSEPKYKDRLCCVEIPKSKAETTPDSIMDALERKKTNCKTQIQALKRKINKTARDGRNNSFLTQLYANVDMALQDSQY